MVRYGMAMEPVWNYYKPGLRNERLRCRSGCAIIYYLHFSRSGEYLPFLFSYSGSDCFAMFSLFLRLIDIPHHIILVSGLCFTCLVLLDSSFP
ncbi:hypothetical protein BDZ91DRAFT_432015 [Kalaharituber pfeilii]|nr:hypothetical protein BDZ91DRAFT_432015 [Kalaharituber pfeilii]